MSKYYKTLTAEETLHEEIEGTTMSKYYKTLTAEEALREIVRVERQLASLPSYAIREKADLEAERKRYELILLQQTPYLREIVTGERDRNE